MAYTPYRPTRPWQSKFGTTISDPETGEMLSLTEWAKKQAETKKKEEAEAEVEEGPSIGDIWAGMQETEQRAATDRVKALKEMRSGIAGTQTGGDIEALRSTIAGATPGVSGQEEADVASMRKLVEGYTTSPSEGADTAMWRNLVTKLANEPETITSELAGRMYEQARVPVEAQTQQNLRDIQQSYYSRGVPGGAMRSATQQAQIGKAGSLGNIQFEIAKTRAEKKKADELAAIGAAGSLATTTGEQARTSALSKIGAAGQMAGVSTGLGQTAYQQLMQKIAAMGNLARYTGSAGMTGAGKLADIYGATVPKVAVKGTALKTAGL